MADPITVSNEDAAAAMAQGHPKSAPPSKMPFPGAGGGNAPGADGPPTTGGDGPSPQQWTSSTGPGSFSEF